MGFLFGEGPLYLFVVLVSSLLPGVDFVVESLEIGYSCVSALTAHDAYFYFGDVEPAGVFGCVVELDFFQKSLGFIFIECLVKTFFVVGVEVVEYHADDFGVGESFVDEVFHEAGEVLSGALSCDLSDAPVAFEVDGHEYVGGPIAGVLVVVAEWPSRLGGDGRSFFSE